MKNRPTFEPHDDFNFDPKKIGHLSRKEFIRFVRESHDHMRELSRIIERYGVTLDDYLEQWDGNLESFDDDVKVLLGEWVEDGTLDHIINENLMSIKADKSYVDDLNENVTTQLAQIVTNVKSFGAKGDGLTDDTEAIRQAINNVPLGGTLYFPPAESFYLVKNQDINETEIFYIDKAIHIKGTGRKSNIAIHADVPVTCDLFRVTSPPSSVRDGYGIEGLFIQSQSETAGRHLINLHLDEKGGGFSRMYIRNNFFYAFTSGWNIYLDNPNAYDGFFASQIIGNLLFGGLYLNNAGDSVIVRDNTIAGKNSVYISLITGSKELILENNNITCRGGITVKKGKSIKIINNNVEAAYSDATYSNGAIIDIDGAGEVESYGMLGIEVTGNDITYRGDVPDFDGIRINKTRRTLVENNVITVKNGYHVNITPNAENTTLGYNLYGGTDPSGNINDEGFHTLHWEVHEGHVSKGNMPYAIMGEDVNFKGTYNHNTFSYFDYESSTPSESVNKNFIWNESNSYGTKVRYTHQKRLADGTLEPKKEFMQVRENGLSFADGILLRAPSGNYWRLSVDSDGNIVTTLA